jgi:chromate reductase
MTSPSLTILGISGSLRRISFNTMLLRAFGEALPAGHRFVEADISNLPLYNDDVRLQGYPEPAARFRKQLAEANAVVFATPEYNYSVPGGLKNAIDWASRPPDQPFARKPVTMLSASTSVLGGARAQYHLRQMLVFLDALPLNKPEVFVAQAPSRFDENGKLTDETTRSLLEQSAKALIDWTNKLKG